MVIHLLTACDRRTGWFPWKSLSSEERAGAKLDG
jgi:hypothetical protein